MAPSVTPFGNEFLVNSYTQGDQQTWSNGPPGPPVASQVVAMSPTRGDFVVAWASHNQPGGSGWDIYAQRYNVNGVPQASPFLVNTTTVADQAAPAVALAANGDFVIAWQTHQNGNWDIAAQEYNPGGTPIGSQFLIANPNGDDQTAPSVATDAAGNFVVAWSDNSQGSWRILAQRFNASGTAQGRQLVVSPPVSANETTPSVSMDSAGDFAIAWAGHQSGSWDVYARRYNASGLAQASPFRVNTTTANDQQTPSLAMDSSGDFVVTWASDNQDGSGWGVYAQRYSSTGAAQGEFQVNTFTTGDQDNPMAAMSPTGRFLITWSSQNQDGNGWGVYQQWFDASGASTGSETRVNTTTQGDQEYSAAAMTDGNLVTIWSSQNQDGNGWGVYGQQYNGPGIMVTPTTGLVTTRAGGAATFNVVLTSQPAGNVSIALSSSNLPEGTLSTSLLTFTPSDWDETQTVTITGQNDGSLMPVPYSINLAAAQSSDPSATSSPALSSTGSSALVVVLASGNQGTNSGAMTLTSLISTGPTLATSPSGGGGGAAGIFSAPEVDSPKAEASAPAPVTSPAQGPPREAVAALTPPAPSPPLLLPSTTNVVPPPARPALPLPVKLDFLQSQLGGGREDVEPATRLEKTTRLVFTTGTVASVGYVVFSSRGCSWLLSALTARPLWKQFDPLEVLFAWEAERKRLGLDAEDETLQSLVE